ncbi:MAG: hypothetical protein M3270_10345 [Thermoproteota archaeon]|nr:hypothetical protein [Thermoproteota archaeon]
MNKPRLVIALLAAVGLGVTVSVIAGALSIQQQQVYAISPVSCDQCAKEFAPGQEKINSDFESTSAKPFAPGQEAKIEPAPCSQCNGASEFAPGIEAKIIGPE